jgi:hypothetical protein
LFKTLEKKLILFQIIQVITLSSTIPAWVIASTLSIYIYKLFFFKARPVLIKFATILFMGIIWWYYRTLSDPEAAVSLLVLIGSLKILELHTLRDFVFALLISLLYAAALTLFVNSLFSFVFVLLSAIIVFCFWKIKINEDFNYKESLQTVLSTILKSFVFILPLSIVLFVFFPRFSANYFPFMRNTQRSEIGFAESINNNVAEIHTSTNIAFRAYIENEDDHNLSISKLYWRGTIHSKTNGYNWEKNLNQESPKYLKKVQANNIITLDKESNIDYSIALERSFKGIIFTLDSPKLIQFKNNYFSYHNDTKLMRTNRFLNILNYKGTSELINRNSKIDSSTKSKYLHLPNKLPKTIYALGASLNTRKGTKSFLKSLVHYLQVNDFLYTLKPGINNSLEDFLANKKGFCTHFASLSAILLRTIGVPSRLVSGFHGGEYNELGKYYIIRDNDAHTWVEYFSKNNKWVKFDPTGFIFPERIEIGGQNLFNNDFLFSNKGKNKYFSSIQKLFYRAKLTVDLINFKWSVFMESFDRSYQKKIAKFLKIKFNIFYAFVFLAPVLFYFIYSFSQKFSFMKNSNKDYLGNLYKQLIESMIENGFEISISTGPKQIITMLEGKINEDEMTRLKSLMNNYQKLRFESKQVKRKKEIDNILKTDIKYFSKINHQK